MKRLLACLLAAAFLLGMIPVVFADSDTVHLNVIWLDGRLEPDGTIVPDSRYVVSALIRIPTGYRLMFTGCAGAGTNYYSSFHADGTFFCDGPEGISEEIPKEDLCIDAAEERFVRLCSLAETDCRVRLVSMSPELEERTVNCKPGYYAESGDFQNDDSYLHSEPVFLQQGQTVSLKCAGPEGFWLLSEWTEDSRFLGGLVPSDEGYHRLTYTAKHDMWVRAATCCEPGGSLYVPDAEFSQFQLYYTTLRWQNQKLRGKKIVAIGDSLFHGNLLGNEATWLTILENETGAIVYNYGIPGNALANTVMDPFPAMSRRYADIPELADADIVLVLGGANDHSSGVPIGSIADMIDSTYLGACNVLIQGIRRVNPRAVLLFFSPYARYGWPNSLNLMDSDYAAALLRMCNAYGIPCYDNLSVDFSFLDETQTAWCDEGIYLGMGIPNAHLSPLGYDALYPSYLHWIESNIE